MVIHGLEDAGPDCDQLEALRQTAPQSRDALYANDFTALGLAMVDNTEAQRQLHPALVSKDAQRVIDIAKEHSALGWKVNGAGGDGGSRLSSADRARMSSGRWYARLRLRTSLSGISRSI